MDTILAVIGLALTLLYPCMFNTYNMGVGMSIVVPADEVEAALEILKANGEDAYVIGGIVKGEEKVILE